MAEPPRQVGEIGRGAVGEPALRLRPNKLGRVEFRGVAREVGHLEPRMGGEEAADHRPLVDRGPIPEKDDGPPEVPSVLK